MKIKHLVKTIFKPLFAIATDVVFLVYGLDITSQLIVANLHPKWVLDMAMIVILFWSVYILYWGVKDMPVMRKDKEVKE